MESRVDLAEGAIVEPQPTHHARPIVFDQNVDALGEPMRRLHGAGVLQMRTTLLLPALSWPK